MANKKMHQNFLIQRRLWILFSMLIIHTLTSAESSTDQPELKNCIVYMGDKPKQTGFTSKLKQDIVKKYLGSSGPETLLRTYSRTFSGFAARMTEQQMNTISKLDGIVSVFPAQKKKLHTTRSWDFLGLPLNINSSCTKSDVIIGVLDTGIWPESASFDATGFGPPPTTWRGSCHSNANFSCNNKIIGAKYYKTNRRFYQTDQPTPRDTEGHGTHTASTASGGAVVNANMLGLATGTARGGMPSSRLAIYKICWFDGCDDIDILAAFDDAIADGVDIISLSAGGSDALSYFNDPIAIGAYHAMKNGVLSSISVGNDGPGLFTTYNVAPWTLGVAASTIDRKFFTDVRLGNGETYRGISLNTFEIGNKMYPLIYGGNAPNIVGGFNGSTSRLCLNGSLDKGLVKGKVVLCDSRYNGAGALSAGASGALFYDGGVSDTAYSIPLAASKLNSSSFQSVYNYCVATISGPTATIFKSGTENDTIAPCVASFSSRGPNTITPDILKPDISAPGVDILAAWPTLASVTGVGGDNRVVSYNIVSGTSMACPHATAVAAYIKSIHPTWSPAAIKSAMMTTAFPMNPLTITQAEFSYGSGNINPVKAINPGLIYDAGPIDYINFLCSQNYTAGMLQLVTGENTTCTSNMTGSAHNLNLPSFALATTTPLAIKSTTYRRTVTNVGSSNSSYKATITASPGLVINVTPNTLTFSSIGESKTYTLTISGGFNTSIASASLVWRDAVHQVRSPIALIKM